MGCQRVMFAGGNRDATGCCLRLPGCLLARCVDLAMMTAMW